MEQKLLFTVEPSEHITLIARANAVWVALNKRKDQVFEKRREAAKKFNEADAAFEDWLAGIGDSRDPAEIVKRTIAARDKRDQAKRQHDDILEQQRSLRAQLLQAHADREAAIGGVQRSLITDIIEVSEPEISIAHTTRDLLTQRQQDARDKAVKVLVACGGRLSCVDLASLIGVSAHGLGGLIDGDNRIHKTHGGRVGNLETNYCLAD